VNRNLPSWLLLSSLCLLIPSPRPAAAFAEDLCYLPAGAGLVNCGDVRCVPGDDSLRCRTNALVQAARTLPITTGGRSMVHTDATFYLAQAVGFTAEEAYWIAAYDEATDLGQYVPHSQEGVPLVDVEACAESTTAPPECGLVTAVIDGVSRLNVPTGGAFFHFVLVHTGTDPTPLPGIDGRHPDPEDAFAEIRLANLRRWVYGLGPNCVAGITAESPDGDHASADRCFERADGRTPVVEAEFAILGVGPTIAPDVALGEQVVQQADGASADVLASDLARITGADREDAARLGIYLHALQDRISHARCLDASTLTGPFAEGADFVNGTDAKECAAPLHLLRHVWEVGSRQAPLEEADRTLEAALGATWDELLAYAEARGFASGRAARPRFRRRVLSLLRRTLQVEDPQGRVDAVVEGFARLGGFAPMPGHGGS